MCLFGEEMQAKVSVYIAYTNFNKMTFGDHTRCVATAIHTEINRQPAIVASLYLCVLMQMTYVRILYFIFGDN